MGSKAKDKAAKGRKRATRADSADRHELYETAVQCVEAEIDFVDEEFRRLRGRHARYLREDFCGTANTSCEWVRRRAGNYATGVDIDAEVLEWGRAHHVAALDEDQRGRVALVEDDVMRASTPLQDVVLAMNFSYWFMTERATLRRYFQRVRDALVDDGVFFLDCFGGYDAFRVLKEKTRHKGFTYVWDQAAYNPVNGRMKCHIHFHFPDGSKLKRAFSYEWRLWTLPEIREILDEAGFSGTTVYWQGWDEETDEGSGEFTPVESADADAGWIAYISALK
ncbi:MAG: class I SAM-dependent methyltransferase [Gammaproteobacteria bacterium]